MAFFEIKGSCSNFQHNLENFRKGLKKLILETKLKKIQVGVLLGPNNAFGTFQMGQN